MGALFVELNAPVVKNVELSAAVRFDHYSDVGSNTSPRVSGRWQAMPQLLMRASAAKGFRAPSLWDLHSPNAFGNTANAVVDPGCPAALIADEDARCVDTQLNVRNAFNHFPVWVLPSPANGNTLNARVSALPREFVWTNSLSF